jgi:uncharacterized protein YjaG (DUF416 family)
MLYTKGALDDFASLGLEQKRAKIQTIVEKMADVYPFYAQVRDMFVEFDSKISENILDYVYEVTMKLVDVNQNHTILADEMETLEKLKQTI